MHQDACQQDARLARIVQSQFSLNRYTTFNAHHPIAVLRGHKLRTVGQGAETEMVA
jgi:hypothetical protein